MIPTFKQLMISWLISSFIGVLTSLASLFSVPDLFVFWGNPSLDEAFSQSFLSAYPVLLFMLYSFITVGVTTFPLRIKGSLAFGSGIIAIVAPFFFLFFGDGGGYALEPIFTMPFLGVIIIVAYLVREYIGKHMVLSTIAIGLTPILVLLLLADIVTSITVSALTSDFQSLWYKVVIFWPAPFLIFWGILQVFLNKGRKA